MTDMHVHIMGTPRGGTSLLLNMLCAAYPHWEHVNGESRAVAELALDPPRISKRPADLLHRAAIMAAAKRHDRTLKAIIVIRDPRDVLTSLGPGEHYGMEPDYYVLASGTPSEPLGYINLYHGIRRWLNSDSAPLLCRYEDLVTNPQGAQRDIETFLNVSAHGFPFAQFHKAGMPAMKAGARAKRLTSAFVGRWNEPKHYERITYLFGKHTRKNELLSIVRNLGYEQDDRWFIDFARKPQ